MCARSQTDKKKGRATRPDAPVCSKQEQKQQEQQHQLARWQHRLGFPERLCPRDPRGVPEPIKGGLLLCPGTLDDHATERRRLILALIILGRVYTRLASLFLFCVLVFVSVSEPPPVRAFRQREALEDTQCGRVHMSRHPELLYGGSA